MATGKSSHEAIPACEAEAGHPVRGGFAAEGAFPQFLAQGKNPYAAFRAPYLGKNIRFTNRRM